MKILHVKSNNERNKEFQLRTIIFETQGKRFVKKEAISKEAIPHLKRMKENCKELEKSILNPKLKLAQIVGETKNSLVFEYIEGVSYQTKYFESLKSSEKEAENILKNYIDLLYNSFSTVKFDNQNNNSLNKTFGDLDFSFFKGEVCFEGVSNIDLILSNLIIKEDEVYIIDYEWVYPFSLPINFSLFRAFELLNVRDIGGLIKYNEVKYRLLDDNFVKQNVVKNNSFHIFSSFYEKQRLEVENEKKQLLFHINRIESSRLWRYGNIFRKVIHKFKVIKVFSKGLVPYISNKMKERIEKPNKYNGKVIKKVDIGVKEYDTICFFSHFDKDGIVDDYVYNYLKSLYEVGIDIVFISTAKIENDVYIERLKKYCRNIIVKENIGYDFGAWKTGIDYLSAELEQYKSMIICNDSVYGPLFNLNNMIESMKNKEVDFWGVTDSLEIKHHLQSYFIYFDEKVIKSNTFKLFWQEYKVYKVKRNIIKNYEVELSYLLTKEGFKFNSYCPSMDISPHEKVNISHFFWKELILKRKNPFLKIELIRDNPMNVDISDVEHVLNHFTSFNIGLMKQHINRLRK